MAWRVFRIKIILLSCKNALAYYIAGVVAVNSKDVGQGPSCDVNFYNAGFVNRDRGIT
jgi:hypothetical protein